MRFTVYKTLTESARPSTLLATRQFFFYSLRQWAAVRKPRRQVEVNDSLEDTRDEYFLQALFTGTFTGCGLCVARAAPSICADNAPSLSTHTPLSPCPGQASVAGR